MAEGKRTKVIILGAGRSPGGNLPSAMINIDENRRLLDWLLAAFSVLDPAEIFFVCGYKASVVEAEYPEIRFFFNPDWVETGPARSLSYVPLDISSTAYICYSDVVFRPDAVKLLRDVDTDCVLAVDTRWRTRFDRRSTADMEAAEKVRLDGATVTDVGNHILASAASAEFAGLMKVRGAAAAELQRALRDPEVERTAGLPELIRLIMLHGVQPRFEDVRGDWAELNAPQDLARFVLGTKAESLARLKPLVRKSLVDELVAITHDEWLSDRVGSVRRVQDLFASGTLIVRSSALSEDCWDASSAGAYKSIQNVPSDLADDLAAAIDEVFASYGDFAGDDQVLVQRMLADVTMSGVIMTRTPTLGAPYYVINFDDTTSRTDSVTSGDGDALRSVFVHRSAALRPGLPPELEELMTGVEELESLVGHDSLDVEFAHTSDGRLHVLQVRPIAVSRGSLPLDDDTIAESLDRAACYFRELTKPSPFLLGSSNQFSVMADWNPAEMIGTKPGRLAFSLYRHLITDEAWAQQRVEYGYRDVRPCNLIVDFLGHPYVDVRTDFNSFVPASLTEGLAKRLVNHYLGHLSRSSRLHDKVEFDILFTCISFDFDAQADRLREDGFDETEIETIRASLVEITRNGMARCRHNVADLEGFGRRFDKIMACELHPLERAFLLFEDVRRLGIPIFSHLARHAFVAVTLLRSLEAANHISRDQREDFLASVRTVPSAMKADAQLVLDGSMEWEDFVTTYGHLRPGSYDITSPSYASAPAEFLRPMLLSFSGGDHEIAAAQWPDATRRAVAAEVEALGLEVDINGFQEFLRQAIEGREFSKFIFMRNVNAGLESLAEFGALHGVSREQLAQIRVTDLLAFRGAGPEDVREELLRLARAGLEALTTTQAVCLPGQIFSEEDFFCFEQVQAEPNFVSQQRVQAATKLLTGGTSPQADLEGKIVLVPNADPGFDWLFSRKIAGLVTMYGGVNSHMTIRASEFQLPAAIGIGELLFERLSQAEMLDLDCSSRRIKVIR